MSYKLTLEPLHGKPNSEERKDSRILGIGEFYYKAKEEGGKLSESDMLSLTDGLGELMKKNPKSTITLTLSERP